MPAARPADRARRIRIAFCAALVVLVVFGGRLFQLQGVDSAALATKALQSRAATQILTAHRGDILDTNGAVLATTVDRVNITVDQRLVPAYNLKNAKAGPEQRGVGGAASALAPLLGIDVPTLIGKLTGTRAFGYVQKDVEPKLWQQVSALHVPGLFSESADRRTYPAGAVAASVLGFLGKDGRPLSGIERAENALLNGSDGKLSYERGAGGQQIATGMSSQVDPVPGQAVQLTIDRDLQFNAQQALSAQVKATAARSGQLVVLDIRTGQVLALADSPTFDGNSPGTAAAADLGSRALSNVFEPGSTSKVITAAAALEEGVATPGTRLSIPGSIARGGKTFHDAEAHGTEQFTLAGVLAKSSNIGAIKIGERMTPQTMHDYMVRFGLGAPTGVGLPESAGILTPAQDWSASQRYTVLFGQGLSVTALQSADVFATIANDGVRTQPTLIKALPGPDGRMQPRPTGRQTRVVSVATAQKMRLMLESVVGDKGTARRAVIPGYRVAGKTGTADYFDDSCHCYSGYTGSFVGMAPADDPRLVVAVYLQHPTKGYFGGTVAAPVFQEVMTYALTHEGIAPTGTKAPTVPLTWP